MYYYHMAIMQHIPLAALRTLLMRRVETLAWWAFSAGIMETSALAGTIDLKLVDAKLEGCMVGTGASESPEEPRITGFDESVDRARWVFEAPAGVYRLEVRARSPYGSKYFEGKVARCPFSGFFDEGKEFSVRDCGLVELHAGRNELAIGGGWGHFEITGLTLTRAEVPAPPAAGPGLPANKNATPAAKALLKMIADGYGKHTLSGQMESGDLAVLNQAGADGPAIFASDLMFYSPSMVERQGLPKDHSETVLRTLAGGHVASLMWHWNAPADLVITDKIPWWRGFLTEGTTFDVAAALADPAGANHALLLRDIDAIALQLRKFADAGVPVLWRPLHEADGAWFWWGAKGPEAFKKLWRLMFDRLTRHHRLNHLLWVATIEDSGWYPGDDVVDVVAIDAYPDDREDPLVGRWQKQRDFYDGRKPLALGEYPGVPDIPRMRRLGVHWAWFCSWQRDHGPKLTPPEEIRRIYQSPDVITLSELPSLKQTALSE
jgi:mannan endo-1,4-beta-mannosidase